MSNETTTTTGTAAAAAFIELVTKCRETQAAEIEGGGQAEAWAIRPASLGTLTGHEATLARTDADVYNLVESMKARYVTKAGHPDALAGVVLVTWGWAAPLDEARPEHEQAAPSKHPQRRRVRLMAAVTQAGQSASRLDFFDVTSGTMTERIDDAGEARGPLADALGEIFY
jgi:hypothetical protein